MLIIISSFLFVVYDSKLAMSMTFIKPVSLTNHQSLLTTSRPIALQIPPPPSLLQTSTKPTIVQSHKEVESLLTILASLDYSKDKSVMVMILPIHLKSKSIVFNINQSTLI
jgi:hypothetical protein